MQPSSHVASPLMSGERLARLRSRAGELLAPDEVELSIVEGDLYLRAFDGYLFFRGQGLLVVTSSRAFFVSGPRCGRRFVAHTLQPPASLVPHEVTLLQAWHSLYGTCDAEILVSRVLEPD